MPVPDGRWLTGVRLERLATALVQVPSRHAGDLQAEAAARVLAAVCGGPHDELVVLLELLSHLRLVDNRDGRLARTRDGDRIAKAVRQRDRSSLALLVLRSGLMHEQARVFIAIAQPTESGDASVPLRACLPAAAQLVGLLRWLEGVTGGRTLVVPFAALEEVRALWALTPPEESTPEWVEDRNRVGRRAELYSFQWLTGRTDSTIDWVSREDDSLGYDLEVRDGPPHLCIEVKGSRVNTLRFRWTRNERRAAREQANRYEIHFWGGISLERAPADEYPSLLAAGYPTVIADPYTTLDAAEWLVEPVVWSVERADPTPPSGSGLA